MKRSIFAIALISTACSMLCIQNVQAEDRSYFFWDLNLSSFITAKGADLAGTGFSYVQPTDRMPRNYAGFEYMRMFGEDSKVRKFFGPFELTTMDLNPHLEIDFHPRAFREDMIGKRGFTVNPDPVFLPKEDPSTRDTVEYNGQSIDFNSDTNTIRMKLVFHDFWFRFKPRGLKRTTFRIGHFDIPYGVNPVIAPRGGQFVMPPEIMDVGLKKDWGIGWKGPIGEYDYELAVTSGMGLGIHNPRWFWGDLPASYLFSARVGAPTYWKFNYGLSGLYGRISTLMGDHQLEDYALKRWRFNLDAFWRYRIHTVLMVQAGAGQTERHPEVVVRRDKDWNTNFAGHIVIDHIPPWFQNLNFKLQLKSILFEIGDKQSDYITALFEIGYSISNALTARLDYTHDFRVPRMVGPEDDRVYLSLNYYQ